MRYALLPSLLLLSACAVIEQMERPSDFVPEDASSSTETGAPPPPPRNARTVEQFDTTTAEQRAEATAVSTGGTLLGETVASLGDAASPGFWVETELVTEPAMGRVVNTANGKGVEVELRPSTGGSSRVSLAAMRLIEAPLTDLVTLEIFRN
ncbi:MAG: D-galactarate dehydratase [Paracoccaceae bacterium]|nr:D-galactarate dehydratase [Paracoccaceae bacterium]